MATNIIYRPGQALPGTVTAGTKSGDPIRVGGLNAVAVTDAAVRTGQTPLNTDGTINTSFNPGGGNTDGNASLVFEGVVKAKVTAGTAPTYGAPVYLAPTGLTLTAGTAPANPLWGHSVDIGPTAGPTGTFVTLVRIAN